MNGLSTGQRSASGQKQKIFTHLLLEETLWGHLSCPKRLSTPSRASKWMKCVQTVATRPRQLQIYVQSFEAEWSLSTYLTQSKKQTQSCLRSLATHPSHWLCVFPTREAGGHKSKSGSLSFSPDWASGAAAASVSSTVLYSASCRSFYITLISKKMGTNSSPNDDEEVLQLSETIIRRLKWSYKSFLERRGLKMLRFLEKFWKPPFPDLLPVNGCVNDVTRKCRGQMEAALPPTFKTHSSKARRRIDFRLVAFF